LNVMKKIKILFCCMGNICRSPTAHGVFQALVEREGLSHRIEVDSAGTHAYHIGNPPDPRSQEMAERRGVDLSELRARKAVTEDFEMFDYVLAMDRANYDDLLDICPPQHEEKLRLFLDFASGTDMSEVPDPYYGGARGFEEVFDLVENASAGLLREIQRRHL
jgi:protein-tyrosine phosphatase